ncbi:hypothetical protein HELRODRAFT_178904 [Helobdella robusta]|uniref:Uncharacterized protein n=1 Tax=Helobdella robusta TaxID=6412 RepID=T1FDV7_HELRO|nr:hypothetical protein HELRODRAFT_178904 [Helobdella robusta]ESN95983.1 hypothetical protein HELRODRAFT_178904 [Helobdella robusta]
MTTTTTTPIDSGKISEMLKKSSQKHRMDAKTINSLRGKVSEQEALIKNLELELDSLKMTSSSSSFLSTTTTTTTTTTSKVDPDLEMDCCKQSEISKLDKKDKPIKCETDLMEQPIKNENERTIEFCDEGGKNKIKDNDDDDSDDSDCLETDYLSIRNYKNMEIIHVDESSGQYQSEIDSTGATNFDELSSKNFCKMDDRHAKKLTFNENTAARSVDRNKISKAQAQNSIPCQSINDADVVPSKLFDKVLTQNKYLNKCVRDLLIKDGKTMQEYLDNLFLKDLLKGKDFEIKMLKGDVLLLKEQLRSCKCVSE